MADTIGNNISTPVMIYGRAPNGTLQAATTDGSGNLNITGAGGGGSGTVTNIATTSPITGGPITTTGTIACATCVTSAASITSNVIPKGSGGAQGLANSSITDNGTTVSTTEPLITSAAGVLSQSALNVTGAPVTGGSGTTTFPLVYIDSGAAPTTFNTNGTLLGLNAPSGFTGNLIDMYVNGVVAATVTSGGAFTTTGSQAAGTAGQIGINGRSGFRSAANGRAQINSNANPTNGLTRLTFGTEATNNPAFSFDGTTATITTCDGAGVAANGIMNSALYKSGGTSGVSAGSFATVTAITTVGGIVTQLTGTSDERLKDAQAYQDGLSVIEHIQPVKYRWNEKGQKHTGISGDKEFVGFLAQNVQTVLPEAITNTEKSKDGSEEYLSFDDRPVVAALVNAVKELSARLKSLEAKQ